MRPSTNLEATLVTCLSKRIRTQMRMGSLEPRAKEDTVRSWEVAMAQSCGHLRSALAAIEQLSLHPASSAHDVMPFELASSSVHVALVALDQCAPSP